MAFINVSRFHSVEKSTHSHRLLQLIRQMPSGAGKFYSNRELVRVIGADSAAQSFGFRKGSLQPPPSSLRFTYAPLTAKLLGYSSSCW